MHVCKEQAMFMHRLLPAGLKAGDQVSVPSVPQEYNIAYAAPETEPADWDFLLFEPSTLHTAALCVQRSGPSGSGAEEASRPADWRERSNDRGSLSAPDAAGTNLLRTGPGSVNGVGSSSSGIDGSLQGATMGHNRKAVYHTDMLDLHCWRTVPLSHDIALDQNDCRVLGSSRLSS